MKTKDLLRLTLALMFAVLLAACGDDNNADPDTPGEEETGLPKLVKTDKRLRFVKILVPQKTYCNRTNSFEYGADGYLKRLDTDNVCEWAPVDYTWSYGKLFACNAVQYEFGLKYYTHDYAFKNSRVQNSFGYVDSCRYEYSRDGKLVLVHSDCCGLDVRISYKGGRIATITKTIRNFSENLDEKWTYSYKGTECNGMCYNVYVRTISKDNAFVVYPELIGLRNKYLPSSVRIEQKMIRVGWFNGKRYYQDNSTCDIKYKWVVNKAKYLEKGSMQQTETSEWGYYDELPSQSNVVKKNMRAKTMNKDVSNYAEEYEFVWE